MIKMHFLDRQRGEGELYLGTGIPLVKIGIQKYFFKAVKLIVAQLVKTELFRFLKTMLILLARTRCKFWIDLPFGEFSSPTPPLPSPKMVKIKTFKSNDLQTSSP